MRARTLAAATAAALALTAAPAAAQPEYTGDCHLTGVTEHVTGQLSHVTATVATVVTATTALASVSVTCVLSVAGDEETVLWATGTGTAAAAEPITFTAQPDDLITLCAWVSVSGEESVRCRDVDPAADVDPTPEPRSPVVGGIFVSHDAGGQPSFILTGGLADPTAWTCSDNGTALPYRVECLPQPHLVLRWKCDVLHADAVTLAPGARARTSMDCNGTGAPEAQTKIAQGYDRDYVFAASHVSVSHFTCTVDGGPLPAVAPYTAFCGDPGLVGTG